MADLLFVDDSPALTTQLERGLIRAGRSVLRTDSRSIALGRVEGPLPGPTVVVAGSFIDGANVLDAIERLRRLSFGRACVLALVPAGEVAASDVQVAADDFALLPSSPLEVCVRLDAVQRRRDRPAATRPAPAARLLLDEDTFSASVDGALVDLTYTEFELLRALVVRRGRVISREELARAIWGYDQLNGSRAIDVHMWRLRTKLEANGGHLVETVRNRGYRLL